MTESDTLQSQKQDPNPDPLQNPNSGAVEAQNGDTEAHAGARDWRLVAADWQYRYFDGSRSRTRIRIKVKSRTRIRIKLMRIRNTGSTYGSNSYFFQHCLLIARTEYIKHVYFFRFNIVKVNTR